MLCRQLFAAIADMPAPPGVGGDAECVLRGFVDEHAGGAPLQPAGEASASCGRGSPGARIGVQS